MGKNKRKKPGPVREMGKAAQSLDFKFLKYDTVGAADAENDNFLDACYVDIGATSRLLDISDPKQIIVGRTGSGKTAVIKRLNNEKPETSFFIHPESLALNYISNSTVLNFWQSMGVNLDIFFKMLWRHIFAVELLRRHFNLQTDDFSPKWWERVIHRFQEPKKRQALEYLRQYSTDFWNESEYNISEITTEFEKSVEAGAKAGAKELGIEANLKSFEGLKESQRKELVQSVQHIVNQNHLRRMVSILDVLDDLLEDPQKPYYILIDGLDEGWVETQIRYRLIRYLIETVRDFNKVKHAKVIIAMRTDLLESVLMHTSVSGFQHEKHTSIQLHINWADQELGEMLQKRVNQLVANRYTNARINFEDIVAEKIGRTPTLEWFISRTLRRPRDMIVFFNLCLKGAVDSSQLRPAHIRAAESNYSDSRLNALYSEWNEVAPNLPVVVDLLKHNGVSFRVSDVRDEYIEEIITKIFESGHSKPCVFVQVVTSYLSDESVFSEMIDKPQNTRDVLYYFLMRLYYTGIIGLKKSPTLAVQYTYDSISSLRITDIDDSSLVEIHPAYRTALNLR